MNVTILMSCMQMAQRSREFECIQEQLVCAYNMHKLVAHMYIGYMYFMCVIVYVMSCSIIIHAGFLTEVMALVQCINKKHNVNGCFTQPSLCISSSGMAESTIKFLLLHYSLYTCCHAPSKKYGSKLLTVSFYTRLQMHATIQFAVADIASVMLPTV